MVTNFANKTYSYLRAVALRLFERSPAYQSLVRRTGASTEAGRVSVSLAVIRAICFYFLSKLE
jgi:hypothetical protein